ncbi:MAG: putative FAD-dependent dehydrogenase [Kiritimatiellia bacterium]
MALLLSNVPWPGEGVDPAPVLSARLGVEPSMLRDVRLIKKSLDARHHSPHWVAAYRLELEDEAEVLERGVPSVRAWRPRDSGRYGLDAQGPERRVWFDGRVVVVGAGPAGLFAALYLAEGGADVVLIDRGGTTAERVKKVNAHWRRKADLDPESNIVFGEGGAGTFSDGKVYTRRRDGELGFVFRRLVDFGADPSILQDAFAHLGTDKLRAILPVFRAKLQELGVDVRYNTRADEIMVENGRAAGVRLSTGEELRAKAVLCATGHSARDSVQMMLKAGAEATVRPIAIGVRIEHTQQTIDVAQYGKERGDLPPASYRLTHHPKVGRKVHTFCMCPGGVVVPASNHTDRVVVNGMSFAARRAMWANSAIIVAVNAEDYGASDPMAGFRWQDRIERKAFELGGGTYAAPAQRVTDLFAGRPSSDLPRTSYSMGVVPCDLRQLLPPPIVEGMLAAMGSWKHKLRGFAGPDAVLIAPETRTTSPVRFERTRTGESVSVPGLYALGEGAGYAGGIITSALDGLRAARGLYEQQAKSGVSA